MYDEGEIKELLHRIALYEDMKAYRKLFDIFFNPLKRFSYSLVKSTEASEEIVSDVFIKIWQIRNKLPELENCKVYFFTIAKNFSLNYIIKHYKNPFVSIEEIQFETVIDVTTPEDTFISAETIQKIKEAISQLPPQCKLIFQLVKEDGLRYKEVAQILNISVLTVRNQVARATASIGKMLPKYAVIKPSVKK